MPDSILTPYLFPFKAMGSPCELKIYCSSSAQANNVAQDVKSEVGRLEKKYTRYATTSVTSQINMGAGKGRPVEIDHETSQLLNYAEVLHQQSDGLFDITSGILRKAWDFTSNQLPSSDALEQLLPLIGWRKVELDANHIYLPLSEMEVDFGGFVKEYAVDVISTLCVDLGICHGLINLGGDIKIIGPHPDGSPWKVGISHPRNPGGAIATVEMAAGGIATSGDYERFMVIDGVRYCHLLNPNNGMSIQSQYASISVIADTCLLAGSFSSTAMLKSPQTPGWLAEIGLPHLKVDQAMVLNGTISVL